MILLEQITNILESLVSLSLGLIIEVSAKVTKEILKFVIILLLVYYFAIWIFQLLDEILLQIPSNDETYIRIGPPSENLIKQRASLLEQLEIEAEFEINQEKLMKSDINAEEFVKKEILVKAEKVRDSDDLIPKKDLFISQIKRELNETSRASQTLKTSLGKKSKLREESDTKPTTSNRARITQEEEDLIKKFEANINQEIKKEILIENSPRETERSTKEIKQEVTYFDDEYDHESFHRV